ncbi:uncharacterized protein LOC143429700 isoform X2 [Xylocopa sonorina]|uniref:uncharacterized protein LOC143429700 isoform X2 n=1 Tax=Xylocopa sonorina TaxID=1818115 RepID=UPI00403A7E33
MAGLGGLALSIGLWLVALGAVVVAHGEHQHLLLRQTLAKCQYDDDCVPNAYCWNQEACLCKDRYVVYKNRTHVECLRVANAIGDPCKADIQCHVTFAPYSECRNNFCQCTVGSHYVEGRCYESIGLGQICQTHRNCYINHSYCVTGYCTCTLKYHPNPNNDGCVRSAELGDVCSDDYECVAPNSVCSDVCKCKVDHVLSSDGKRCLRLANSVGDSCEEDAQCQIYVENSWCGYNGKCSCIENFHRHGTLCVRDIKLYDICRKDMDCITETYRNSNFTRFINVNCVSGICVCAKDYIFSQELHDCVRYSQNGATKGTSNYWRTIFLVTTFVSFASYSML